MPKWALYGLAAIADFAFAAWFYSRGRLVLPAILTLAGICFVMATIGVVMKKDRQS
jgi:hypothetical protein